METTLTLTPQQTEAVKRLGLQDVRMADDTDVNGIEFPAGAIVGWPADAHYFDFLAVAEDGFVLSLDDEDPNPYSD